MNTGNTVIDFFIVIFALGFMVYYSVRNPWWTNTVGSAIFALAASVALIPFPKVLITLIRASPHDAFYVWAELFCKVPVVLALVFVIVAMHVATKKGKAILHEHTKGRL